MSENTSTKRPRIRGLDGLRAIAATLVLIYHLVPGLGDIGFIGVDVFFVISGFLITALLMKEWDSTAAINLRSFWRRRFRRLVPAVVLTVVGALALARIAGGDALVQLRWQTFGALTGTYNWLELVHGSSYFSSQSPLLLANMWSLSLEQQFYFLWPLIACIFMFYMGKTGRIITASCIGLASLVLHVLVLGQEPTRSYVGTDTHLFGLIIGALIALSLPGIMQGGTRKASPAWGWGAWVALVALVSGALFLPSSPLMYPWGLLLASLLSAVVIRGILPDVNGKPSLLLARTLDLRPLVWLGERSYGIYLWHWPLWVIFSYATSWKALHIAAVVSIASIVLAHLSYVYVETPVRVQGLFPYIRSIIGAHSLRFVQGLGAFCGVFIVLASTALFTSRPVSSAEELVAEGQKALEKHQQATPPSDQSTQENTEQATEKPSENQQNNNSNKPKETPQEEKTPEKKTPEENKQTPTKNSVPVTGDKVTIIGDSVTLAASPSLLTVLPGAVIDAKVSRLPGEFTKIAAAHDRAEGMREYVVISLATNGLISERIAENILSSLDPGTKIVFVTGFGPERAHWIPGSNATIQSIAERYPDRVRVADWGSYAAAHQDLLASDLIHPKPEASEAYSRMVLEALNSF